MKNDFKPYNPNEDNLSVALSWMDGNVEHASKLEYDKNHSYNSA